MFTVLFYIANQRQRRGEIVLQHKVRLFAYLSVPIIYRILTWMIIAWI